MRGGTSRRKPVALGKRWRDPVGPPLQIQDSLPDTSNTVQRRAEIRRRHSNLPAHQITGLYIHHMSERASGCAS